MKKLKFAFLIISSRFKNVRKELFITFVICITSIFILDFWLKNINEIFSGAAKLGDIYYKLCLSYISAFVFYFVNIHINNERLKTKMFLYINNKIADLVNMNQSLISSIIRRSEPEVTNYQPDFETLRQYCLRINPHKPAILLNENIMFKDWFEALNYVHKKSKRAIDDLINIKEAITSDVLELLSRVDDCLENHVNISKGRTIGNQDMEVYSHGIYDYTKLVYKLHKVMREKYKYHEKEHHEKARRANLKE